MSKENLALNNLICPKTKPRNIIYIYYICLKRISH